jgi:hypothetical protein
MTSFASSMLPSVWLILVLACALGLRFLSEARGTLLEAPATPRKPPSALLVRSPYARCEVRARGSWAAPVAGLAPTAVNLCHVARAVGPMPGWLA